MLFLSSVTMHAQDNPPVDIAHAIRQAHKIAPTGERLNFLSTLSNSKDFGQDFAQDVNYLAKKDSIIFTSVSRGNMIEFKTQNLWPLGFKCQLYLAPQQGVGILSFNYIYKGRELFIDDWLYLPGLANEKTITRDPRKKDDMADFCHHAEIAALMIKNDLYLPDLLYARLSDNFFDNESYLMEFKAAFTDAGLSVSERESGIVAVDNCRRVYLFNKKLRGKWPMPYETSEKW